MSTSPIAPLTPAFAFSHRPSSGTDRQAALQKAAPNAAAAADTSTQPQEPRQISPLYDRRLTGPPPDFQLSLLEVETSLDTAIKRLEQARATAQAPPGTEDTETP